jgi:hypothetical protein
VPFLFFGGGSYLWCSTFVRLLSLSSLFSSRNIVWSFGRLVGRCDMGVVGRRWLQFGDYVVGVKLWPPCREKFCWFFLWHGVLS